MLSTGALVVFGLIAIAMILFVTEAVSNDVTAIGIIVALALLEPITGVGYRTAISGFSNPATLTILAMFMLSAAIQRTGLLQRLGSALAQIANGSDRRALAATIVATGPLAGFINNTPVVAIFIPMITELADQLDTSPSKLLLPLSYAAILGGTLTLIGTSTNLIASEFAVELLGREPIGMFEFTALGLVILAVGTAYLLTVGRWMTPARIPPATDLLEQFDLEDHLTHVRVGSDSAPLGRTVDELEQRAEADIRVLQLRRMEETPASPTDIEQLQETPKFASDGEVDDASRGGPIADGGHDLRNVPAGDEIQVGDVLTVHGTLQAVNRFVQDHGLRQLVRQPVTEETFGSATDGDLLAKVILPPDSAFCDKRIPDTHLRSIYRTTVLAVRRGGELFRRDLDELRLEGGDMLLLQTVPASIGHFYESNDLVVIEERADGADMVESLPVMTPKAPVAVAILAMVVAIAALGVVPIVIAALGGVLAMIATGCLSMGDAYESVSWNIIFLLAGVIPLGYALEATGGAAVIATGLIASATVFPIVLVVFLLYLLTGFLSNLITPVASVVLMIPVAIEAAASLGASEFSFLLTVMFASATSFMTPIGYQTNLMIYGPGGYIFTDFLKVGAPLQGLLAIVTTAGIVLMWGI